MLDELGGMTVLGSSHGKVDRYLLPTYTTSMHARVCMAVLVEADIDSSVSGQH